jgi:hypothetical protein
MNNEQIEAFLERYGQAISTGDLPTIVDCWSVPALVLSDQGAMPVSDPSEVEHFFAQAVQAYHAHGLMSTRPALRRVDALSAKLVAVEVDWPAFDAGGNEQARERSYYIVAEGEDGQPRIRVALTRES